MIHVHDAATPMYHTARRDLAISTILTAAAVAAFLLAPRGAQFELLLLAIVPIATLVRAGDVATALARSPLLVACAAFGLYITINAAWSVNHAEAYGKVLFYWALLVTAHLAITGIGVVGDEILARLQKTIVLAVMAGAVFLAVEVLTDQAIRRFLFSLLPFMRPPSKHTTIVDGEVAAIGPYILNRNMAALCLVLWPVLLMLRTLLDARRALMAGAALVAVSLIAVLRSEHETSMLALVCSITAFAGMMVAAPVVRKAITVGWVVATLLVVPMVTVAYQQQLHMAEWLPLTARNRVILWGYTAGEVAKVPILGIGVASTKELDEANADKAVQPPGYTYALRTGPHAHNVFLQTWYELGGVGAVLLLAMGLCVIAVLSRLPRIDQALAFAGFVAAVMIGSFTWGMWQTWFMAAYGIWAVLLALAFEGSRRQARARRVLPEAL
jgi:hypothetical protein